MENKVKNLKLFATKMKKKFALITGLSIAALPGCGEIQTTEVEPENTTNSIVTEQEENNTKTEIETIVEQEIENTTKKETMTETNTNVETTEEITEEKTQENTEEKTENTTEQTTKKPTRLEVNNHSETTKTTSSPRIDIGGHPIVGSSNPQETTKQPETTKKTTTTVKIETTKKTTQKPQTTTKRTTTTTTTTRPQTTTEPVTEAPTEPYYIQRLDSYCLEDIKTNLHGYDNFSMDLKYDMFRGQGYELTYGETYGGQEGDILLAILNYDQLDNIDENVLGTVFSDMSENEIRTCYQIIYNIAYMRKNYGITVDFTKYTLNREVGEYINSLATAAENGSLTEKIYIDWYEGQMPESLKNHPAAIGALASYDMAYNDYADLDQQTIDEYIMNDTVNDIIQRVCGKSYTRF